jgi:hypothetical protein
MICVGQDHSLIAQETNDGAIARPRGNFGIVAAEALNVLALDCRRLFPGPDGRAFFGRLGLQVFALLVTINCRLLSKARCREQQGQECEVERNYASSKHLSPLCDDIVLIGNVPENKVSSAYRINALVASF